MKFSLIRFSFVLTASFLALLTSFIGATEEAQAFTTYQECITEVSANLSGGRSLSDRERNEVVDACRESFPNSSTSPAVVTSPNRATSSQSPSSSPSVAASARPSTEPSSVSATSSESNAPSLGSERPYGGFINDSRGVPTLDPQQYVNAYQGGSFSRLTSTRDAFGFLTSFALSFIGMVAIMFLIYAGFVYITANGEQSKIDKAKKLIWGTIIGILIVFSVYAVVATLLNISAAVSPGLNVGPLNVGPGGTTLRIP